MPDAMPDALPLAMQKRREENRRLRTESNHPLDTSSPNVTRATSDGSDWWVDWAGTRSESWKPCHYCGQRATEKDHLESRTWSGHLTSSFRGQWVWSCRECNLILGDKRIPDTEDRRAFVAQVLIERYEYDARHPVDLDGLEGALLRSARAAATARDAIHDRLIYATGGRWTP